MKQKTAQLLLLAMIASVVTACGDTGSQTTETKSDDTRPQPQRLSKPKNLLLLI